eukprot:TRINITY_DN9690_c0_g1_i1.p1 TRINITY_DN9690_c0_g1~~TRINITY_DN9690_c0_g1_i1.p1  ORF type:complete len:360 (+),score=92.24 TRINITY_DN9690_c0_g1_i1:63-1142(+)
MLKQVIFNNFNKNIIFQNIINQKNIYSSSYAYTVRMNYSLKNPKINNCNVGLKNMNIGVKILVNNNNNSIDGINRCYKNEIIGDKNRYIGFDFVNKFSRYVTLEEKNLEDEVIFKDNEGKDYKKNVMVAKYLSLEEIKNVFEQLNEKFNEEEIVNLLNEIKNNSDFNMIEKWNFLISNIIIPLQFDILLGFGFDISDPASVIPSFNKFAGFKFSEVLEAEEKDQDLVDLVNSIKELNIRCFDHSMSILFDLQPEDFVELSTPRLHRHVTELVDLLTKEELVNKIGDAIAKLPENCEDHVKGKTIMNEIMPYHLKLLKKYGFEGEKGYIQAQRAISIHFYDSFVQEKAQILSALILRLSI